VKPPPGSFLPSSVRALADALIPGGNSGQQQLAVPRCHRPSTVLVCGDTTRRVSLQCHPVPGPGKEAGTARLSSPTCCHGLHGHAGKPIHTPGSSGATRGQGTLLWRGAEVTKGDMVAPSTLCFIPRAHRLCLPGDISWDQRWTRGQREDEGWQRLARTTESQNHRIVGVGRDLCGSSSPTPC